MFCVSRARFANLAFRARISRSDGCVSAPTPTMRSTAEDSVYVEAVPFRRHGPRRAARGREARQVHAVGHAGLGTRAAHAEPGQAREAARAHAGKVGAAPARHGAEREQQHGRRRQRRIPRVYTGPAARVRASGHPGRKGRARTCHADRRKSSMRSSASAKSSWPPRTSARRPRTARAARRKSRRSCVRSRQARRTTRRASASGTMRPRRRPKRQRPPAGRRHAGRQQSRATPCRRPISLLEMRRGPRPRERARRRLGKALRPKNQERAAPHVFPSL